MNHRFAIITPTMQRESLIQTCESVDRQTYQDRIHVVVADCSEDNFNFDLATKLGHQRRVIALCGEAHVDGGNTCRREQWDKFAADWWIYLDDDNYLSDENILADIATALDGVSDDIKWAIFPITRLGGPFFNDPPRSCHIDTLNLVLRHEVAQWPDTNAYGSDGILVDDLMARGIPYAAFPDFRPIGVIPKVSFCQ